MIIDEGVKIVETAGSAAAGTPKAIIFVKDADNPYSPVYSRVQESWDLVSSILGVEL